MPGLPCARVIALAAALALAVSPGHSATVRVPVANVWQAPNAGHLPLDPRVWPTPAVTVSQRLALVGPTKVGWKDGMRRMVAAQASGAKSASGSGS